MGPSLDERIGRDHGIRVLDALLAELDWSEWEGRYAPSVAGRPPIHPRLMAGAILYGLLKKIRSTRELEEATRMRLDFQWFLEERTVDHTTFATFKGRFDDKIARLFNQINRRAAQLRKATLEEIVVDGTRLRANSDRHGARTAQRLRGRLERLEEQMAERLRQLESESEATEEDEESRKRAETLEFDEFRPSESAAQPADGFEDLKRESAKLEKALQEAERRDKIKATKDGAKPKAVRVPVSDPDSYVLPNKEGGYAPNYTPVVAVESESGLIVSAVLAEGHSEAATVPALLADVCELRGEKPERMLFDSNFASGPNLEHLASGDIEAYAAIGGKGENPALRPDGSVALQQAQIADLPMRGKQFDKAAFLYDAQRDCYYCPNGRVLEPKRRVTRRNADGISISVIEYYSAECSGCAFSSKCLRGKAKARTVSRDEHEYLREELAERMRTASGEEIYGRRAPLVEGTIGTIKSAMGVRGFARRGTIKAGADWHWICSAYNLGKLIRRSLALAPQDTPRRPRIEPEALQTGVTSVTAKIMGPALMLARLLNRACSTLVLSFHTAPQPSAIYRTA